MAESETCILASTSLCNTHIHKNQGFSVLCPFSFPFSTLLLFIWFLQSHFLPGFKSRKAGEPEIKLPMSVGSSKKQESSRKPSTSALLTTPKPLTVDHSKLWKILKEMGIPDRFTCFLGKLYAGQEATVITGHGTTDWFQIGKGVR